MALTDNEGGGLNVSMPVAPAYGGYGNNGGLFGGDGSWLILWLICMMCGGWGGFGMGGMMWPMMMGGMGGGFGLDYLYPWLNNSQHISDGFRDQNLQTSIGSLQNSITSGFGDVATQLCGGFAGINQNICQTGNGITAAVTSGVNSLSQQLNQNQLSSLERSFAAQTANTAALNALQAQQAQCCCDNRAGLADLKYTVATENCADRAALSDGIRDLLAATQAQTQTILTQLCNDKLEAKNDTIAQLRSELLYARGQASQDVQTARILAGQVAETDAVYTRLSQCPVGTVPVFGNQPIFTCPTNVGNNCGCGCGCNG